MNNSRFKFRQAILDDDGGFLRWHYWGYIQDNYQYFFTRPKAGLSEDSYQAISCRDKNDKNIYEDDIIKHNCKTWTEGEDVFGVVAWGYDSFVVQYSGKHKRAFYCEDGATFQWKDVEIVGTQHQNPELLEKNDE